MKYLELINFNPIESIIQLTAANDKTEAVNLVKSYVMSDDMADKLENNMISQLKLEDAVDNKGVLLVGNYGTGKSHLMSVISSIALDEDNLQYMNNKKFAESVKIIAGKFEVLRIEIGASKMSLRNIILTKVKQDFADRGLSFDFPDEKDIITNKDTLAKMMEIFATKYPDRGYLIVVDEFLDYLGGRNTHEVKMDLGFMREIGEFIKKSKMRAIFGVQEKLFDNPNFSFVSDTLNRVKDRFEQVIIRKEDTAYVVSERILKKDAEQRAKIREHLLQFCSLYTNMSERIEEYVNLFPIHPSYIDVFNKIYIIENRHILKNISEIIRRVLNDEITSEAPGIISFDSYWSFIKENMGYRTDVNIKEVVEKSGMLEDIVNRSFPIWKGKTMILKGIGATTEIDRHNCRIAKEALEVAANDVNNSGSVPSVGLNHDRTIMPFGKVISAEVLPMDNGEFKMEITQEIFEHDYIIELENGLRFIMNRSNSDVRPFAEENNDSENIVVSIDYVNFETQEGITEIQSIVKEYSAENGIISRKSFIPDPEMVIQISNGVVGVLLSKKIIDSVGDRVVNNLLDEVDKFYALVRSLIIKYSKLVIPKNRPQTYVFKMWLDFNIELVVVTNSADEVMASIEKEKLEGIHEKIKDLKIHFDLNRVQFLYTDGGWVFNYLCTNKGEVIGTEMSYKRRTKALELFKLESDRTAVSAGGES